MGRVDEQVIEDVGRGWEPTAGQRWEWVKREMFPVAWLGAVMGAVCFAFVPFADEGAAAGVWGGVTFLAFLLGVAGRLWWRGGAVVETGATEMRVVMHDRGAWVAPWVIGEAETTWVSRRAAVAQHEGAKAGRAIAGGELHVKAEPPQYPYLDEDGDVVVGEASAAYVEAGVVELGVEAVGTEDHLHEYDHLLAFMLYGGRMDWAELDHDERIALLERPYGETGADGGGG